AQGLGDHDAPRAVNGSSHAINLPSQSAAGSWRCITFFPALCRRWTVPGPGAFFLWSAAAPQYAQAVTFTRTFTGLAQVARAVRPAGFIGEGWRTSRSKILDNAMIGFCKLNKIAPVHT
ncbi:MAG: hypothetical protein ACRDOI_20855, partial [Trebonia sp.]